MKERETVTWEEMAFSNYLSIEAIVNKPESENEKEVNKTITGKIYLTLFIFILLI